ncbi:unnamed protein product [Dovyalis caffra]|uniref:glycerophosphodiester phosphodiesterase n=1 Tax=Dovyalis caffra TaxID=77055 RepID=A0AAV1S4A0_9ROSI|nr:unnamed protein product [Dovyalis caffra]
MVDPDTGIKTNLLRMKSAGVVGVYHPLIDEKLVTILHRRNKKAYAWTVDDVDSMQKMLFEHVDAVVTNNPNLLQQLMQDIRTECREEAAQYAALQKIKHDVASSHNLTTLRVHDIVAADHKLNEHHSFKFQLPFFSSPESLCLEE